MSVTTLKRLIGIEYSYKLELQSWFATVLSDELLVGWSSGANTPAARTALRNKFVACGPTMGFSAKQFAYGILELVIDALVNNVDVPTDPYVNALNSQLVNVTRYVGMEGDGDFNFMVAVYNLSVTLDSIFTNVASVNNAPAGTNKTITMVRSTVYTFAAADFGFTDPLDNPADDLLAVKVTTLPAAGTLKLVAANVVAGNFIPLASIGSLNYTPVAAAFGSPYSTFTFQVRDDGGTAGGGVDLDATPNTITFNVT